MLGTAELPAGELHEVVDAAGRLLGADSARLLVADYGLLTLQELGADGPTGDRQAIDGTLAGRALVQDEVVVHGTDPAIVSVPLADGHELMGVFELTHPAWTDDLLEFLAPVVRLLALVLISKRRYTDVVHRTRRVKPLSVAAELQWDLLPPLACTTACVSVSGILEPAYSIGGDSFDYAMNEDRVGFAIVDAVGHGMPAVLLSTSAINCLRNARREGADLAAAYRATGDVIETQFAHSYFVTAQLGSLAFDTGELTWLNAGHPPPLLVRDCTYLGELACRALAAHGPGRARARGRDRTAPAGRPDPLLHRRRDRDALPGRGRSSAPTASPTSWCGPPSTGSPQRRRCAGCRPPSWPTTRRAGPTTPRSCSSSTTARRGRQ